uniref:Uncharacterized protein n=1 Tax=Lygus hesperus TaxID=30085 RepID=A0A146M6W9_LYGHE
MGKCPRCKRHPRYDGKLIVDTTVTIQFRRWQKQLPHCILLEHGALLLQICTHVHPQQLRWWKTVGISISLLYPTLLHFTSLHSGLRVDHTTVNQHICYYVECLPIVNCVAVVHPSKLSVLLHPRAAVAGEEAADCQCENRFMCAVAAVDATASPVRGFHISGKGLQKASAVCTVAASFHLYFCTAVPVTCTLVALPSPIHKIVISYQRPGHSLLLQLRGRCSALQSVQCHLLTAHGPIVACKFLAHTLLYIPYRQAFLSLHRWLQLT